MNCGYVYCEGIVCIGGRSKSPGMRKLGVWSGWNDLQEGERADWNVRTDL